MVAACAIVFVPCHNQQAIVRFDKLDIGAKIILKPGVSLRDGAIMHVVIEIRNDEGDRRQGSEVSRKLVKGWLLALCTLEKSTHGLCLRA